ncbi:MAG: hypothetical protein JWL84_2216 [Rhodospirillales bacterium]|nr:hypothetical protein [Rhodospirillales bacterium]
MLSALPHAVPKIALFALAALAATSGPLRAEEVDIALVLAVDVSGSIDTERFNIQRDGYAAAFSNPQVLQAIATGSHGAIAVTFVEWSGPGHEEQTVGWTVIRDAGSSAGFGSAIKAAGRAYSDWTSISAALDFSVGLLRRSGYTADRLVIDVSGDGPNNSGRPVEPARDEAVAAGITINGLPITETQPNLDDYYRSSVVGGDGAFVIVVEDFDSFAKGVLSKLVREIADAPRNRRTLASLPAD